MSVLLRVAELNAAYAATIDTDRLESWPDLFVEDCLYKITSAENHKRGHSAGVVYADSRAMLQDRVTALRAANIYERQSYRHKVEPQDDVRHLDIETHEDGGQTLRRREDGSCVHLGPEGCTVYAHRPRGCRTYDCRLFSLLGIVETAVPVPHWTFSARTREEKAVLFALRMMVVEHSRGRRVTREVLQDNNRIRRTSPVCTGDVDEYGKDDNRRARSVHCGQLVA